MNRIFLGLVCALVTIAAGSGMAMAADNPGLADFEPRETNAMAGEPVDIALTIQLVSTNDDEAIKSINYSLIYDPDVLSVDDIEQGPWLEGDDETEVSFETSINETSGRLTVEQARDPPAGGVTGDGTTAVVTFEVAPDAPPTSAIVEYDRYNAQMLEYPVPVLHDRTAATVHIDGGGDERPPRVDTEDATDDSPTIITPDSSAKDPGNEDPSETDVADQSGFGVVLALVALLSATVARAR